MHYLRSVSKDIFQITVILIATKFLSLFVQSLQTVSLCTFHYEVLAHDSSYFISHKPEKSALYGEVAKL